MSKTTEEEKDILAERPRILLTKQGRAQGTLTVNYL